MQGFEQLLLVVANGQPMQTLQFCLRLVRLVELARLEPDEQRFQRLLVAPWRVSVDGNSVAIVALERSGLALRHGVGAHRAAAQGLSIFCRGHRSLRHGALAHPIRFPLQPDLIIHVHTGHLHRWPHLAAPLLHHMPSLVRQVLLLPRPEVDVVPLGVGHGIQLDRLVGVAVHANGGHVHA